MKIKLGALLLLVAVGSTLNVSPASAQTAARTSYKVTNHYTLSQKKVATLRQTITATNKVAGAPPSSLVLPVAGRSPQAIKATGPGGQALDATYDADSHTINVEVRGAPRGRGDDWKVSLRYQTTIGQQFGKVYALQLPALDYDNQEITSEAVELATDLSLGLGLTRGAKPNTRLGAGEQFFTWRDHDSAMTGSPMLLFGDTAVARVDIKHKLQNDGWWWKTFSVTLPPDTNQQQVTIESINPKPTRIRLDVDGNVIAEYRLGPRRAIEVTASALITNHNYGYALSSSQQKVSQITQDLVDRYTPAIGAWQDSEVQAKLTASQSAGAATKAIYNAVVKAAGDGALDYQRAKQLADQLVGELRAAKIPARTVLGRVLTDGGQLLAEPQSHAWAEAYVPGVGWMTLDPALGQFNSIFGTSDVLHVGMVLRGERDDWPPEQLDGSTVEYLDVDPPAATAAKPELKATNFMLLPGLALRQVTVKMPGGGIVDDAAYADDGQTVLLGSLAPLQEVATRTVAVGGQAFSGGSVSYGQLDSAGTLGEAIAQAETTVSYLPMITLAGLLLGSFIVRKLFHRRPAKVMPDLFIDEPGDHPIERLGVAPVEPEIPRGDTMEADSPEPEWRPPSKHDGPRSRPPLIQG